MLCFSSLLSMVVGVVVNVLFLLVVILVMEFCVKVREVRSCMLYKMMLVMWCIVFMVSVNVEISFFVDGFWMDGLSFKWMFLVIFCRDELDSGLSVFVCFWIFLIIVVFCFGNEICCVLFCLDCFGSDNFMVVFDCGCDDWSCWMWFCG